MQVFLEGQQEPWFGKGKLLLLARQKFGTGVNFCRNHVSSIPTNSQLNSGHKNVEDG